MSKFSLVFLGMLATLSLSGCTVLGALMDSKHSNDQQNAHHPSAGQVQPSEPSPFTELGMAIDGAVINKVKELATPEAAKPKQVCKHNGYFTECRPRGKQQEKAKD